MGEEKALTKKASIKKNFIYHFISQVLSLLIPLATAPYLSRVLRPEGNGQISYVTSIITYFTMFASLGFNVYGQREIAACGSDQEKKSEVFWEICIVRVLFTAVALGVLYSVQFSVGFGEKYDLLMLIMSAQVVAVVFDIQFFFMGEENFRAIALRTIVLRLTGLVCVFLFVKTEADTWIYALCLSGSTLLSNLIMWVPLFRRLTRCGKLSFRSIFRHVKPALIIFFPMMVTSIFTTFDKTMIGWLSQRPDYDNGCYEQAYRINSVAQMITTLFSSVMLSRNTADFQSGNIGEMNRHTYKSFQYVSLTSLLLAAGFFVLSKNFSSWFFGDEYVEVPLLLYIMSVRLIFSGYSIVLGDRFIVMGREKFWTAAVATGAVANVLVNLLLIPKYGAVGAAVATAITETAIFLVMAAFSFGKGKLSLKETLKSVWKYFPCALFSFGAMFLLQRFLHYSVWEFLLIGCAGTLVYGVGLLLLRDRFSLDMLEKLKHKLFSRREKE